MKEPKSKQQTRYRFKDASPQTLIRAKELSQELNAIEEPYYKADGKRYIRRWYVGKDTTEQLHVDIDGLDIDNLRNTVIALRSLFPYDTFEARKTKHGYHVFDLTAGDFENKNLKVLCTDLAINPSEKALKEYKTNILQYLDTFRKSGMPIKGNFNNYFEKTPLCKPVGKIDYLHNILAVENGVTTIRMSLKGEGDTWELVNICD